MQNPSTSNEYQQPGAQEMLDINTIRNEVDLAYEPIHPKATEATRPREQVGQSVLDAAQMPNYLDQLAAASETETMTSEQKLMLIGVNIQAMRRHALKDGKLNTGSATGVKALQSASKTDYAEAA